MFRTMLLSKHCGIIITCFVGDLLVVSFSTRSFRSQLLFCDVIKVWYRLGLHAFTHYLSTNCLCLQENATINFCPLKVRSRAMGKIMPSDIYHFYPLVLNLLSRNLTVNRLSVTDDWNMEKMDGHLKRNVKKFDIKECLTFSSTD